MFSLLHGLWSYVLRKEEYHILILGIDKVRAGEIPPTKRVASSKVPSWRIDMNSCGDLDAQAGKTTLLERIKTLYSEIQGLDPSKILPTVGLNIGQVEVSSAKLIFWDLGGQVGLRSIWEKYFEEAHAVIFVVDSADHERLCVSRDILEGILSNRDLKNAPVMIVANKQDKEEAYSPMKVAETLGVDRYYHQQCTTVPACSYTGDGIGGVIHWLVNAVRRSPRTASLRRKASSHAA